MLEKSLLLALACPHDRATDQGWRDAIYSEGFSGRCPGPETRFQWISDPDRR